MLKLWCGPGKPGTDLTEAARPTSNGLPLPGGTVARFGAEEVRCQHAVPTLPRRDALICWGTDGSLTECGEKGSPKVPPRRALSRLRYLGSLTLSYQSPHEASIFHPLRDWNLAVPVDILWM